MRNRLLMLIAALLLVPVPGMAQTPQPPQPPQTQTAPPASPFTGLADVGGLFTTTDGDEARYERYRDTRDGLYSSFTLNRETASYLFDANASHVGYRDQRYDVSYVRPKVKFGFQLGIAAAQLQLPDPNAVCHQRQHADAGRQRAACGAGSDQRHCGRHGRRRALRAGRPPSWLRHPGAGRSGQGRSVDL